jgi:hypothetical protein
MIRHLKNINEACVYAGISCGIAFLVRLNPALFYPVLFVRLGILFYCWFVIFRIENNKAIGAIIAASTLIGWLGGYWDYIELIFRYKGDEIIMTISLIIAIIIVGLFAWVKVNGKSEKNN